jgi:hypothetical protein
MRVLISLIAFLLAQPALAVQKIEDVQMYCTAFGNATTVVANYRNSGQPPQQAFDMTKQIFGKWIDDKMLKTMVNTMYFRPGTNFDDGAIAATRECLAYLVKPAYQPLK